jgi:hypothetical protein
MHNYPGMIADIQNNFTMKQYLNYILFILAVRIRVDWSKFSGQMDESVVEMRK